MLHQRSSDRGRHHPRHRYPTTALLVAAGLVAVAVLWTVAAVPALVKYPTDVDATPRYEGTFTVLVNPATTAPLAQPLILPLTVERHIQAVGDESTSSRVVVHETIAQHAGDVLNVTQSNTYVMDRSTVQNVADSRASAFEPANVVDRSGTYRVNLPFGTSGDDVYQIYKNETGAPYQLRADSQTPIGEVEGLSAVNFTANVNEAPVTEAYLAELRKAAPLPASLTLDQMKPQLLAAGLDVDALLAALTPRLTAGDRATLATVAAQPVGLVYVLSFAGRAAVEPTTGAEVRVDDAESVGVRPQLTSLPALQAVLGHYPDVSEAVAARATLDKLANGPAIPIFSYRFDQTPASVADVAAVVASQRRQVLVARVGLPLALIAAALVSLVTGAVVFLRRRPRPIDPMGQDAEPDPPSDPREASPERELVNPTQTESG